MDNDNRTTSIQLSGSSSYNVEVNGQRFDVKGDRFTTSLPSGLSIIKRYYFSRVVPIKIPKF